MLVNLNLLKTSPSHKNKDSSKWKKIIIKLSQVTGNKMNSMLTCDQQINKAAIRLHKSSAMISR